MSPISMLSSDVSHLFHPYLLSYLSCHFFPPYPNRPSILFAYVSIYFLWIYLLKIPFSFPILFFPVSPLSWYLLIFSSTKLFFVSLHADTFGAPQRSLWANRLVDEMICSRANHMPVVDSWILTNSSQSIEIGGSKIQDFLRFSARNLGSMGSRVKIP